MGMLQGGELLTMPDSPSIMMDCASSRVRATRAMRPAWLFSTLGAYPFGSGASLAEAASGED